MNSETKQSHEIHMHVIHTNCIVKAYPSLAVPQDGGLTLVSDPHPTDLGNVLWGALASHL